MTPVAKRPQKWRVRKLLATSTYIFLWALKEYCQSSLWQGSLRLTFNLFTKQYTQACIFLMKAAPSFVSASRGRFRPRFCGAFPVISSPSLFMRASDGEVIGLALIGRGSCALASGIGIKLPSAMSCKTKSFSDDTRLCGGNILSRGWVLEGENKGRIVAPWPPQSQFVPLWESDCAPDEMALVWDETVFEDSWGILTAKDMVVFSTLCCRWGMKLSTSSMFIALPSLLSNGSVQGTNLVSHFHETRCHQSLELTCVTQEKWIINCW